MGFVGLWGPRAFSYPLLGELFYFVSFLGFEMYCYLLTEGFEGSFGCTRGYSMSELRDSMVRSGGLISSDLRVSFNSI